MNSWWWKASHYRNVPAVKDTETWEHKSPQSHHSEVAMVPGLFLHLLREEEVVVMGSGVWQGSPPLTTAPFLGVPQESSFYWGLLWLLLGVVPRGTVAGGWWDHRASSLTCHGVQTYKKRKMGLRYFSFLETWAQVLHQLCASPALY